jgi:hypothetical protein
MNKREWTEVASVQQSLFSKSTYSSLLNYITVGRSAYLIAEAPQTLEQFGEFWNFVDESGWQRP